jgi:hypothetical protein
MGADSPHAARLSISAMDEARCWRTGGGGGGGGGVKLHSSRNSCSQGLFIATPTCGVVGEAPEVGGQRCSCN